MHIAGADRPTAVHSNRMDEVPDKYLVEVLPVIKYIPAWFPGATVQRLSAYWKSTIERLKEEPYPRVKAARVSYTAIQLFLRQHTSIRPVVKGRTV